MRQIDNNKFKEFYHIIIFFIIVWTWEKKEYCSTMVKVPKVRWHSIGKKTDNKAKCPRRTTNLRKKRNLIKELKVDLRNGNCTKRKWYSSRITKLKNNKKQYRLPKFLRMKIMRNCIFLKNRRRKIKLQRFLGSNPRRSWEWNWDLKAKIKSVRRTMYSNCQVTWAILLRKTSSEFWERKKPKLKWQKDTNKKNKRMSFWERTS